MVLWWIMQIALWSDAANGITNDFTSARSRKNFLCVGVWEMASPVGNRCEIDCNVCGGWDAKRFAKRWRISQDRCRGEEFSVEQGKPMTRTQSFRWNQITSSGLVNFRWRKIVTLLVWLIGSICWFAEMKMGNWFEEGIFTWRIFFGMSNRVLKHSLIYI